MTSVMETPGNIYPPPRFFSGQSDPLLPQRPLCVLRREVLWGSCTSPVWKSHLTWTGQPCRNDAQHVPIGSKMVSNAAIRQHVGFVGCQISSNSPELHPIDKSAERSPGHIPSSGTALHRWHSLSCCRLTTCCHGHAGGKQGKQSHLSHEKYLIQTLYMYSQLTKVFLAAHKAF